MTPDEIVGGLRARARFVKGQLSEAEPGLDRVPSSRVRRITEAAALDEAAADLIEELLRVSAGGLELKRA
jgi:hypothetical protein